MQILFDTSVLIAALVEQHPKHEAALPWLAKAQRDEFTFLTTNHVLAECFAVLTKLPISPTISSANAKYLIEENVLKQAKIITLNEKDYQAAINRVTNFNLPGGIIYDALIFQAAKKAKAEKLISFNQKDFAKLNAGEDMIKIISP